MSPWAAHEAFQSRKSDYSSVLCPSLGTQRDTIILPCSRLHPHRAQTSTQYLTAPWGPSPGQQQGYLELCRGTAPDSHHCHQSPNVSSTWCRAAARQDKLLSSSVLQDFWGDLLFPHTCRWLSHIFLFQSQLSVLILCFSKALNQSIVSNAVTTNNPTTMIKTAKCTGKESISSRKERDCFCFWRFIHEKWVTWNWKAFLINTLPWLSFQWHFNEHFLSSSTCKWTWENIEER